MPATFGVINTHDLEPQSGHVSESSMDSSVEVATIRDEMGLTKYAGPKPLITRNVTISGKGLPNFSDVAVGNITAQQVFITSVKRSESNDDFPDFEIEGVIYEDA